MLAKQMAQAAAAQAGPGFGNFMGMAMGMPQPPGMGGMGGGSGFGGNQTPPNMPASAMAMDPPGPTGGFFGNNARSPPNPSPLVQAATAPGSNGSRREMRGPSGVDDILKTFEDVRRAEMETIGVRTMPVNSFVQSEQATQQQPAMVAVSELQSVASDDYSQAESTRSGINGRRGRGRRPAPVGNTVSLDV